MASLGHNSTAAPVLPTLAREIPLRLIRPDAENEIPGGLLPTLN